MSNPPNSIEISVGTIIELSDLKPPRKDVIVATGEGQYFFSAELLKTKNGQSMLKHTGTVNSQAHFEIRGKMTIEEVVEAFRKGSIDGWPFTKDMEKALRIKANRGSRQFILNE